MAIGLIILIRLVWPIVLSLSCIVRYNMISLIYGLVTLISLTLTRPPQHRKFASSCLGVLIITCFLLSSMFCLGQVIFHGYLLYDFIKFGHYYGSFLKNCSNLEIILRNVGFQRLEPNSFLNIIRVVGPDIISFLVTLLTLIVCINHYKPRNRSGSTVSIQPQLAAIESRFTVFTQLLVFLWMTTLLCVSGIINPSLLSFFYLLSFICIALSWSLYKKLGNKFAIFRIFIQFYSGFHVLLQYLYQFQIFQNALPPSCLTSRLLGLNQLVYADCHKPWVLKFLKNSTWPMYASPLIQLTFYVTISTMNRLNVAWTKPRFSFSFFTKTFNADEERNAECANQSSNSIAKRHMKRYSILYKKLLDEDVVRKHYNSVNNSEPEENIQNKINVEDKIEVTERKSKLQHENSVVVPTKPIMQSTFAVVMQAFYKYSMRHSHFSTLIVMMAWSITYHSWLSFVMLLAACIIWMTPQKSKLLLKLSPVIVFYAVCLIMLQYIWGLDLTDKELPVATRGGYNLSQLGLVKYKEKTCIVLLVQIIFTLIFFLTMRQWTHEKKIKIDSMLMQEMSRRLEERGAPSSSNAGVEVNDSVQNDDPELPNFIRKFGTFLISLFTKYWILVCCGMLIAMGLLEAVVFRIIYMMLFLMFVIVFQMSYRVWRMLLLAFWWIVIIYSMIVLVLLYTYQFDKFDVYWKEVTGFSAKTMADVGFEKFSPVKLFTKLLTPSSFLVVIIIQLHYFHAKFLNITDLYFYRNNPDSIEENEDKDDHSSNNETNDDNTVRIEIAGDSDEEDNNLLKQPKSNNVEEIIPVHSKFQWKNIFKQLKSSSNNFFNFLWRFAEVHWFKLISILVFTCCIYEVSAINVILVVILLICLPIPHIHSLSSSMILMVTSATILFKMGYQMSIAPTWVINCTNIADQKTFNNDTNAYLGFEKANNLADYLKRYIAIVIIVSLQGVIKYRQQQYYNKPGVIRPDYGTVFHGITRENADNSLFNCFKFMLNYGFYKFGEEICFSVTMISIWVRIDVLSVIYTIILVILISLKRRWRFFVWPVYVVFLIIFLAVQYIAVLGIPPAVCQKYIWDTNPNFTANLKIWLFLPSNISVKLDSHKLFADFFQLLFASRMWRVYYLETDHNNKGGSNEDISLILSDSNYPNPVKDFTICKQSYLDYLKIFIFQYLFWVCLIIIFIAGVNRVTLFGFGYLFASFLLLRTGLDMFLKQIKTFRKYWNLVIAYTLFVVFCKSCLQLVGCVYADKLKNHCWVRQLFNIVCFVRFSNTYEINDLNQCNMAKNKAGLTYDALTFIFVIILLRTFRTHYFRHVIEEIQVENSLASTGADIINNHLILLVENRKRKEARYLNEVKVKMQRIKMRQFKIQQKALLESNDHYINIRSGDYYMFDDVADETEVSDSISELSKEEEDSGHAVDDELFDSPLVKLMQIAGKQKQKTVTKPKERGTDVDTDEQIQKSSTDAVGGSAYEAGTSDSQEESPEPPTDKCFHVLNNTWSLLMDLMDFVIEKIESLSAEYNAVAKMINELKINVKNTPSDGNKHTLSPSTTVENFATLKSTRDASQKEQEFKRRSWRLFQLISAFFQLINAHSAILCYFAMILNVLMTASALSIAYPLSIFLWALLTVPRPSKRYWLALMAYTEIIILVKYLFKFEFLSSKIDKFKWPEIIGIKSTDNYSMLDLLLLFCLFIHRSNLRRFGLWKGTHDMDNDLAKACVSLEVNQLTENKFESGGRQNSEIGSNTDGSSSTKSVESIQAQQGSVSESSSNSTKLFKRFIQPIKTFYDRMVDPTYSTVVDVYKYMFLCDFINFFIAIFFYSSFGPGYHQEAVTSAISQNKVPKPFLIMMIVQFLLIVIDRALYLRKRVFGKLIYQLFLVLAVHVVLFFVLPFITERKFINNTPVQIWYVIKCIYFGLSALQIRSGYPTQILGNFICKHTNVFNLVLFQGFLVIPFLFELRTLMDWIWTDTTLALTSWIQVEDMFNGVFIVKCWRRFETDWPNLSAVPRSKLVKYGAGGFLLVLLIVIIWFPLFWFSLISTAFVTNPPIDVTATISLGGYQQLFQYSAEQQYLHKYTEDEFNSFKNQFDKEGRNYLEPILAEDVYEVKINGNSTNIWGISPPSQMALYQDLINSKTNINVIFTIMFRRPAKEGKQAETVRAQFYNNISKNIILRQKLAALINGSGTDPVLIENIFPPYLRVPTEQAPKRIEPLEKSKPLCCNITLKLQADVTSETQIFYTLNKWWETREVVKNSQETSDYLKIITINDRLQPSLGIDFFSGASIIGIYVSIVFVIGRFLRTVFFEGQAKKMIYDEMPDSEKIFKLILELYLVRECQDFKLEEELFAQLHFLYRTPETMLKVTKLKID